MRTRLTKFLLIALLLLNQASSLAHELDLDAHHPGETCEICLLHASLDDFQLSADVATSVEVAFTMAASPQEPFHPCQVSSPYHSRAPPPSNPV